jgi:hypothetical protein
VRVLPLKEPEYLKDGWRMASVNNLVKNDLFSRSLIGSTAKFCQHIGVFNYYMHPVGQAFSFVSGRVLSFLVRR